MPQTRMFRDRVVSMEQTLEGGEKHLDLLKSVCHEAFPEFVYREHTLDHERDLFVLVLEAPDGRKKTVGWTRMVLFDAERIPVVASEPESPLRARLVGFLRTRETRSEILVTFRHMEEGWVDTPEPRREKRRGRRGRPEGRGQRPPAKLPSLEPRGPRPAPPAPKGGRPAATTPAAGEAGAGRPGGRRRRFRRRRRGRGPVGPSPDGNPAAPRRSS